MNWISKHFARGSWFLYAVAAAGCLIATVITGRGMIHPHSVWLEVLHIEQAALTLIFSAVAIRNYIRSKRKYYV